MFQQFQSSEWHDETPITVSYCAKMDYSDQVAL